MKQFNLEEALKGAKVVTRGGRKVSMVILEDGDTMFPVAGYLCDGRLIYYTISGRYNFSIKLHEVDLMMEDEQALNIGDDIQFPYDGEILEGKVTHVLQNNRIIARSNGNKPVFANVGMYDVALINKDDNE